MIKLLCVGKIKDKNLRALIDDYAKKINHYHKLEIIEVKDEKITDNEKAVLDIEANRVLEKINNDEYVIIMDLHGESMDSLKFADKIDRLAPPRTCPPDRRSPSPRPCRSPTSGLGEKLIDRANDRIKLSDMTFLHQMCRLILLEQIYRSFKILHNETYHK